jgi:hypothetical protein
VRRAYSGLSRRDRAIDAAALIDRAKQLGPLLDAADDECANCGQPRSYHRATSPHDRVKGDGRECRGFEEEAMA